MKFFVLWLILGNDKFPYHHYTTKQECVVAGENYIKENNNEMTFKCVEW